MKKHAKAADQAGIKSGVNWFSPESTALKNIAHFITDYLLAPAHKNLKNINFGGLASLINNPQRQVHKALNDRINLDKLSVYKIISALRTSKTEPIEEILDNYLERIDGLEWALTSLAGKKLPIVEAVSADLHQLLRNPDSASPFSSSLKALLDEVSNIYKALLAEFNIIAWKDKKLKLGDIKYGHFFDWVSCKTEVDRQREGISAEDRKAQQCLRYTMMKVILSYLDNVNLDTDSFRSIAKNEAKKESETETINVQAIPGAQSGQSADILSNGAMKLYAGVIAATFEHIFISTRRDASQQSGNVVDQYQALPLTLKIQKPELLKTSMRVAGNNSFNDVDLEITSELLAMKLATTNANYSSGLVHTAIVCIANGIWEISPNNPPLVETIASFVSVVVYEIEKAITYDLLHRFRIYITDKPIKTDNNCVLMISSMQVPDYSESEATEKTVKAIIALRNTDDDLINALRGIFGQLPLNLDVDDVSLESNQLARLLHGLLKDTLAIGTIVIN